MSEFIDAMTALGEKIAKSGPGADLAPINEHLAKLDDGLNKNTTADADTRAGLEAFIKAAQGTTSEPAPEPAPEPEPEAA